MLTQKGVKGINRLHKKVYSKVPAQSVFQAILRGVEKRPRQECPSVWVGILLLHTKWLGTGFSINFGILFLCSLPLSLTSALYFLGGLDQHTHTLSAQILVSEAGRRI